MTAMTDLLALLNRFENAAGVYERSTSKADRDELHAARRAILERDAELVAEVAALRERNFALVSCLDDQKMEAAAALVEREAELVKALERANAQITLLTEAHSIAGEANRSAWQIAERDGQDTNWEGHRKQLMHALETSHEALSAILHPKPKAAE